jgi:hypothetical protein
MLVFSTQLCELLPPLPTLVQLPPSPFPVSQHTDSVLGGGGGVLSPVGYHILQEFEWYLTRFRTYKIARPPQTP